MVLISHLFLLFLPKMFHTMLTVFVLFSLRVESKIWSPLVTEEGKSHPYKMNLASNPQVSDAIPIRFVFVFIIGFPPRITLWCVQTQS